MFNIKRISLKSILNRIIASIKLFINIIKFTFKSSSAGGAVYAYGKNKKNKIGELSSAAFLFIFIIGILFIFYLFIKQ